MSVDYYFVVNKQNSDSGSGLDKCKNDLIELAKEMSMGIHFDNLDRKPQIFEDKEIVDDYLVLSDSFEYQEADDLFNLTACYEEIKHLPLAESLIKEKELLFEKFSFLNNIIDILFKQQNIASVDFYCAVVTDDSDADIHTMKIYNGNLTMTFVDRIKSSNSKQEKYFGVKTTKFLVVR